MEMAIELFVTRPLPVADFLREALGFEFAQAAAGFMELHRGGAAIYLRSGLDDLGEGHPFARPKARGRRGFGVEIVLDVEDLAHAHEVAVALGLAPTAITVPPWGGADFRVTLPDGFYFRIREAVP